MQNKSVKYSSSVVLWTLPYIQEPNFHTETLWKHVHFSSKATNMGRNAMASCVPEQFPNWRMLARKLAQYWSGTLAGHHATFGNTLQKCGSSPQGMKTGWPDLTSFSNPLALESEAENQPVFRSVFATQGCVGLYCLQDRFWNSQFNHDFLESYFPEIQLCSAACLHLWGEVSFAKVFPVSFYTNKTDNPLRQITQFTDCPLIISIG